MRYFVVRDGTSKTNAIINVLRQVDGAKHAWATEHGQTGAVSVTVEDVAPYLSYLGDVRLRLDNGVVAGERYRLGTLAESAEVQFTKEVGGHPKGTVIRFTGTNGMDVEIIDGPTNGSSR